MSPTDPIFKPVFGDQWATLPRPIKARYAVRAGSADRVSVEGKLDVDYSRVFTLLAPIFRLLGTLVPHRGRDVPVRVTFSSPPGSAALHLDRVFGFPGRAPARFSSRLVPQGGDRVVEFMRYGIGWKSRFFLESGDVIIQHVGYVWRLFGFLVPLPIGWIVGRGYASETPISDRAFSMSMELVHPLLGRLFEYHGTFEIEDDA